MEQNNFIQPTIFKDVNTNSDIYKEEVFGPVVIVNSFETEAEVVKEANNSEYGLFSSVYTSNLERAIRVAKTLEAGSVGVNCAVPLRALDMPNGGWKQSGIGRELAMHAIHNFTESKTIFLKYGENIGHLSSHWHSMPNGV